MTFEDWLQWIAPRFLAYLVWVGLWWFMVGKFGYRGKSRVLWFALFLIPPIPPYLIFISNTAFLLLLLLPWPVWKEVKQGRRLIENRPMVKATALKPGQIYYIKLPDNRWAEARYTCPAIVKGETRYRFNCGKESVVVHPEKIRTAY